jgi:general secretion pathway protein B
MSFILEALKKSENERRAGIVPGLGHGPTYIIAPGRRPGHAGFTTAAAGAMLVVGLVLGSWRHWPSPQHSTTAAVVELAVPATAVRQMKLIEPLSENPQIVAPAKVMTSPKQAAIVPARPPGKAAVGAELKPVSTSPALLPTQVATATRSAPKTVPAAGANTRPAALVVSNPSVVEYRELPDEIRAGLPKIVFGGYAGVDETEGRIAFINNLLVKEGEEVSPGLKLEQVGGEGVVLGYKGHHFRPGP